MKQLWFWKLWLPEYKIHFYILASLTLLSLILFSVYHYKGIDSVLAWEHFQEQKTIETSIHEFNVGAFEISVPTEVFLLFEYFQGGRLQPGTAISYFFVFVLACAFVYLVSIFSALERFWYLAASALVILFLVSLRLDVLQIVFFNKSWFSISVIALYVLPSFYFNAFNRNASFPFRLFVFAGITFFVALVIYFLARVELPFLYLSVTCYLPAIVLTLLFVVMVAHEIPAAFLYLTSHYLAANGLKHFLAIMIIYLLNLVVLYLSKLGIVEWNLVYLNIYLVFSITAVVGLWGWRHRETLYGNVMPFVPFGAYFYLALCSVAFATLAFFMGTANDAALKVLSDLILFCHIGFGAVLVLYVFSNFLKLIDQNLSAWKVLYKPNRMPYETFRLGGIVVIVSFMIYNGWRDYINYSFSGFWTSMADLYVKLDKEEIAQLYFEQGRTYGPTSHHANYAKAYYHSGEFQWAQSHEYYRRANFADPSVYSLANDANVYNWEGNIFKGIASLNESLTKMQGNPYLLNNLGFQQGKVHALDTALQLLNNARGYSETNRAAETNFIALLAQERVPVSPDSIASVFSIENNGVAANVLALSVITRAALKQKVSLVSDTVLTLHTATLLNNYLLAKAYTIVDAELNEAERMARMPSNIQYSESLKSALAHAHYLQGNVSKAMQLMSELSFVSASNQGKYNFIVGLWMLEQGNAEGAAVAFRYAVNFNYAKATFYLAIAETENRNLPEASYWWDSLYRSGNEEEKQLARTIKPLLTISFQEALKSTDAVKYQYVRYRLSTRDTIPFSLVANSIENVNYKAQTFAEMAVRQLEADRPVLANKYIEAAASFAATSPPLRQSIAFSRLRVKASLGQLDALADMLTNVDFTLSHKLDKLYYEGLLNEAAGNKALADKAFAKLAIANPFYEEGIMAAAAYARLQNTDPQRAYTILSEAVQVNKTSVRLWKAYIGEALRLGYDDYASSARSELQKQMLK
jgi:hypothetical protein